LAAGRQRERGARGQDGEAGFSAWQGGVRPVEEFTWLQV